METGKWIPAYVFIDPIADEVLISLSGPSAGVVNYLEGGSIAYLSDMESDEPNGFMLEGVLKEMSLLTQRAADGADSTLPKLSDLKGIAPNATGNLSSEEFIRRVRDEW